MPVPRAPRYTAGLVDLPDDTPAPETLLALGEIVQRMSFAIVPAPLAPALQGCRVVRGQFGLSSRRMLPPALSADSQRAPNFTKALFEFFRHHFPKAAASSCTVAFHRLAPLHIDCANMGLSYAAALGSTAGGNLWVAQPSAAQGLTANVTKDLCEFDALVMHTTLPFEGPRYYISFYCHRAAVRTSDALRSKLIELSVPLPSFMECITMLMAAKQRPPLHQRRADGMAQWAAYLRVLTPSERNAAVASQQRKGGSWVCMRCHAFGPLASRGGNPRNYCSRACENKQKRSVVKKTLQRKQQHCRTCLRAFVQRSSPGGQLRYCWRCRRACAVSSSTGLPSAS